MSGRPPIRVLAFTCSRHRPYFLRHCILQMREQSYPVDHSVYINGEQDTRPLYEDLVQTAPEDRRLLLQFGPTATNHVNHLHAISGAPRERYDLFCKIDDDDVYHTGYIAAVVADFEAHGWDYSGGWSDGMIKGARWLRETRLPSLGLGELDFELGVLEVMPPTAAFSRRGIEHILSLGETCPPAHAAWRNDDFEDIGWRRAMAQSGLSQRARRESLFTYHIHGSNNSTGHMLDAADARQVEAPSVSGGAITEKWASLGGERGFLGSALTPEIILSDGQGCSCHFEGGSIYWTREVGAHEVHGEIRKKWLSLGRERGRLGYPISDEHDGAELVNGRRCRVSEFQRGRVVWEPEGGTLQVFHGSGL